MLRKARPPKPITPWIGPKPTLAMHVSRTFRVSSHDLEAYLGKVYRMREVDLTILANPGQSLEYAVSTATPAARNFPQLADDIRRGRRTRNLGLVLNVLCIDGFLPEGRYVIEVQP